MDRQPDEYGPDDIATCIGGNYPCPMKDDGFCVCGKLKEDQEDLGRLD